MGDSDRRDDVRLLFGPFAVCRALSDPKDASPQRKLAPVLQPDADARLRVSGRAQEHLGARVLVTRWNKDNVRRLVI